MPKSLRGELELLTTGSFLQAGVIHDRNSTDVSAFSAGNPTLDESNRLRLSDSPNHR